MKISHCLAFVLALATVLISAAPAVAADAPCADGAETALASPAAVSETDLVDIDLADLLSTPEAREAGCGLYYEYRQVWYLDLCGDCQLWTGSGWANGQRYRLERRVCDWCSGCIGAWQDMGTRCAAC